MPSRLQVNKRTTAVGLVCCTLVGGAEGLRQKAYLDPVKIPTACFGETKGIKLGMEFTREQCETMLITRLVEHETGMQKCIKVPVKDETYVAFLSFTYNAGVGAFCKSTLARKLNAGDTRGACDELLNWNKATLKGVRITLPGLTKRRQQERALCLKGV